MLTASLNESSMGLAHRVSTQRRGEGPATPIAQRDGKAGSFFSLDASALRWRTVQRSYQREHSEEVGNCPYHG